jgi:hypothetical protein
LCRYAEDLVEEEGVPESLTLAAVAEAFNVQHIPSRSIHSTHASVLALINEHGLEDTFCMVDLATVKALYDHMVGVVHSPPGVRVVYYGPYIPAVINQLVS